MESQFHKSVTKSTTNNVEAISESTKAKGKIKLLSDDKKRLERFAKKMSILSVKDQQWINYKYWLTVIS